MSATTETNSVQDHSFLIRSSTSLIKYLAEYAASNKNAPSELLGVKPESLRLSNEKKPPYFDLETLIDEVKVKDKNITRLWYHIEKPIINNNSNKVTKGNTAHEDNLIEVVMKTNTPVQKGRSKSMSESVSFAKARDLQFDDCASDLESDSESDDTNFAIEKKEKDSKHAIIHRRKSKRLVDYHVSDAIQEKVLAILDQFGSMSALMVVEGFPTDMTVKNVVKILKAIRIGRFAETRRHPTDPTIIILACDAKFMVKQYRGETYTVTDKKDGTQFHIQFKTLNIIATSYERVFRNSGY